MKPSEVIFAKIFKKGGTKDAAISAIIDYLDEEWEKNNQTEMEEKICSKCGFSGEIDQNNICWSSECKEK